MSIFLTMGIAAAMVAILAFVLVLVLPDGPYERGGSGLHMALGVSLVAGVVFAVLFLGSAGIMFVNGARL